jgi:hypothetical protein
VELPAGELVRLHDRDDFFHAVQRLDVILVEVRLFAHRADHGAELPARHVRLTPHALDLAHDAVHGLIRCGGSQNDDHGDTLLSKCK